MPNKPEDTARACYLAYVNKDRAAIEALLAEDFHFTSPRDNRLNRATYFDRCWPNSVHVAGIDFIEVVHQGEHVFVVYEATEGAGHRFRNAERLTIRGNQIHEAEVYFGWSLPHRATEGGFLDSGS
jgi:hypothetical protein